MGNSREAMCKGYIRFLPPSPGNLLLSHVLAPHVSSVFVFGGGAGRKGESWEVPLDPEIHPVDISRGHTAFQTQSPRGPEDTDTG